jgi:muramoyltetrapeptide carboxypeptidase
MSERRAPLRIPAALRPGDAVAVVAPSSPFPREELDAGLAWLRTRYEVRVSAGLDARAGYLAGDDARRAAELAGAMLAPDVRAIVAARGGYGAMRILDALPWAAWAARPSWLVGFSDVTALHVEAWRRGVATVHGPNVTGLGHARDAGDADRAREVWSAVLEAPKARRAWEGLEIVHAGGAGCAARGPLVGGNLALLEAMAAAGRLTIPQGAILALEEVTERPYRVDRMLTALRLGGHLARAAAIVLGGFTKCDPGPDGARVEEVLAERTVGLGVPVLSGAPFGHGARNDAFVLGRDVEVQMNAEVEVEVRGPSPVASGALAFL